MLKRIMFSQIDRGLDYIGKELVFRRTNLLVSFFAVVAGGMIYLVCRPTESLFYNWFRTLGMGKWLEAFRSGFFISEPSLPGWFIYSVPNALWAFAYACLITAIWSNSRSYARYFWMASIPMLVVGYEVLQYSGHIPGTYCIQDVFAGLAGLSFGIIFGLSNKFYRRNGYEKTFTD